MASHFFEGKTVLKNNKRCGNRVFLRTRSLQQNITYHPWWTNLLSLIFHQGSRSHGCDHRHQAWRRLDLFFVREKKRPDVWEAHRLRCLGTQKEQRRKYTGPSWSGQRIPTGNCKASRWFLVVRGDGGCLLSNCPTVWLSANHHRSSQAHPCHQQCSKDAPDDPPPRWSPTPIDLK